jgi:hypothetical protein
MDIPGLADRLASHLMQRQMGKLLAPPLLPELNGFARLHYQQRLFGIPVRQQFYAEPVYRSINQIDDNSSGMVGLQLINLPAMPESCGGI